MIQENRPVILGHNLVYDLAFLYSMFVDELPLAASDFWGRLRWLFPRLIDTKVLISQDVDPDVIDLPLEETFAALITQVYPATEEVLGWRYNTGRRGFHSKTDKAHDAGFDSKSSYQKFVSAKLTRDQGLMTAMVFLKLSCRKLRILKLYSEGKHKLLSEGSQEVDSEGSEELNSETSTEETPAQVEAFMSDEETRIVEEHMSNLDQYLPADDIRLPDFQDALWILVKNKLRMSTAGIVDLGVRNKPALGQTCQVA